ncbi:autotransporter domain-containing protein, partial [Limnohabitans sp.]|uniref:autotransporter outer membrane beta-barrel domain-containing protein n=1 Tax=Limnohabitans sp. TaxID=1907725 RepID=UPI0035AED9B4
LPPSGIKPTLPGGVTPPIGTLPPSGVMTALPGGVTPPIATLPPSGVKPTLPGGVTPPIGTLPPSGVMPTLPGGVTPPIGTLPPSGVMPTIPGVVTPPIGTLPPSGVKPTLPGGVTPPIATLPPTEITPSLPGGVTPPIGTLPPSGEKMTGNIALTAVDGYTPPPTVLPCSEMRPSELGGSDSDPRSGCHSHEQQDPQAASESAAGVPITAGRDLVEDTLWNTWVDTHYTSTSDHRNGLDTTGNAGVIVMGADRRVASDLVAGLQLSLETSSSKGFQGVMTSDSDGFMISPYMAYQVSPQWSLYGALGLGQSNIDNRILSLNGSYEVQRYSATLNAQGQYPLGSAFVRPKFTLSYMHNNADAYNLGGSILGTPINLRMPKNSYDFGTLESSVEINRVFRFDNGSALMPYAEIGIAYDFERPDSGRYLDGDLVYRDSSPWIGMTRLGMRSLVDRTTLVEFAASYLSLGTNDLAVWDLRLFLSHSF